MQSPVSLLRASAAVLLTGTVLLGAGYPLVITVASQVAFPHQAGGSLIEKNGKVVGSELLGQEFSDPKYFWGRLSATTPPYNAAASAASNFNPANPKLLDAANMRIAQLQKADPENHRRIPATLITASASGLDPHITLSDAAYQLPRVAKARRLDQAKIWGFIRDYTEGRSLGLIGEPRVNVLKLNLALDAAAQR